MRPKAAADESNATCGSTLGGARPDSGGEPGSESDADADADADVGLPGTDADACHGQAATRRTGASGNSGSLESVQPQADTHATSATGSARSSGSSRSADSAAASSTGSGGITSGRDAITAAALLDELAQDVLGSDHHEAAERPSHAAATGFAIGSRTTSTGDAAASASDRLAAGSESLQPASRPRTGPLHATAKFEAAGLAAPPTIAEVRQPELFSEPEPEADMDTDTIEALFREVAAGVGAAHVQLQQPVPVPRSAADASQRTLSGATTPSHDSVPVGDSDMDFAAGRHGRGGGVPESDHHASALSLIDDAEWMGRRGVHGGHRASVISLVDESEPSEPMAVSELFAAAAAEAPQTVSSAAVAATRPRPRVISAQPEATVTVLSHVQTAPLSPAAASAAMPHGYSAYTASNSAALAGGSELSESIGQRVDETGSTTGSASAPSSRAASPIAGHLAGRDAFNSLCGLSECTAPSVAGSVSGGIDSRRSSVHYNSDRDSSTLAGQADAATAGSARDTRAASHATGVADAMRRAADNASGGSKDTGSGSGSGRAGGSSVFGFEERDVTASAAARALSAGVPPVSPAAAPVSPHRRRASADAATPTGASGASSRGFDGKRNSAEPVTVLSAVVPHPPAQTPASELPSLRLSSASRPSRRTSGGKGLSRFRVLPSMMFAKTGAGADSDDDAGDGASGGGLGAAAKGAAAAIGTGAPVKTQPDSGAQSDAASGQAGGSRLLPQLMAPHRPSSDPPAPLSGSMLSPASSLGSRRNTFRPTLAEGATTAAAAGGGAGGSPGVTTAGPQGLTSPSKVRGRTGAASGPASGSRGLRLLPSMMFAAPGAIDESSTVAGNYDSDDVDGSKSSTGGAAAVPVRERPVPPTGVPPTADAGATVSSSQATHDRRASWRGRAPPTAAPAHAAGTKARSRPTLTTVANATAAGASGGASSSRSAVTPLALSPSGSDAAGFNMPTSPVHTRPWLPPGVASPRGDGPLSARSRGDSSDEKEGRARRSWSPIPRPDASVSSMASFRIVPVQHESPWKPPGAGAATFTATVTATDASATEHRSSSLPRAAATSVAAAVNVSPRASSGGPSSYTGSPTRSPASPRRADPSSSPAAPAPAPVRKLPSASLIIGGFISARKPAPTLPASTAAAGPQMTQP